MNSGNIDLAGRTSKSRRVDTYLEIALSLTRTVTSKTNPDKVMSLSPGLFGQIFKIYTDYALMQRLSHFDQRSRVYAAPKLSATAAEHLKIQKNSDGINTRFAAVNPFDPRVLLALTPEPFRRGSASVMTGADLSVYSALDADASMRDSRGAASRMSATTTTTSPMRADDISTGDVCDEIEDDDAAVEDALSSGDVAESEVPDSDGNCVSQNSGGQVRGSSSQSAGSPSRVPSHVSSSTPSRPRTPTSAHAAAPSSQQHARPHTPSTPTILVHSPAPRTPSAHRPSSAIVHTKKLPVNNRTSTPIQSGSTDYRIQSRCIHPGLLQGMSPHRRRRVFNEPNITESPDGKLVSEHTRITLIPHRVTATQSGQLLAGGVETAEEMRNEGTIALQAVKKHKVTK
jgi:hypothetical protein